MTIEGLVREGLAAFAAGRMAVAVEKLEQALAQLTTTHDPARLDVIPPYASALARTGELARAESLLTQAAQEAAAAGDRRRDLHALVELYLQSLQRRTDDRGTGQAARLAETAIREFGEMDDALGLAKAWHLLADVQPTWAATTEMLERALVHAQRCGDRRETADVVWWLGVCFHHAQTPVGSAIQRCEELLGAVAGDRTVEAGMLGMLAGLYAMQGRFDEAREHFGRGLAILEELGIKLRMATRRTISGEIELLADDPVAAELELRWGYERLVEMGERADLPAIAAQLAEALYRQGRFEEAEHFARESEQAHTGGGTGPSRARSVRAKVLAQRGQFDAADALAREAVALVDEERLNVHGDVLLDRAQTLELAGRREETAAAAQGLWRSTRLRKTSYRRRSLASWSNERRSSGCDLEQAAVARRLRDRSELSRLDQAIAGRRRLSKPRPRYEPATRTPVWSRRRCDSS